MVRSRPSSWFLLPFLLVVALAVALLPRLAPSESIAAACRLTPSVTQGDTHGDLFMRVDGSSSSDVWAVGSQYDGGKGVPLAERWNGTAWERFEVPNVASGVIAGLHDVVSIAPDDAWAVGSYRGGRALTEHWDGSAWNLVPSPGAGDGDNEWLAVTATSSDDVWAVGKRSEGTDYRTMVGRWGGSGWRVVPSPNVGTKHNVLRDVDARAAADVWAVGWRLDGSGRYRTLAQHWDGSTWQVVPTPNTGRGDNILAGVTVVGKNDAWAVGWVTAGSDGSRSLALHWDGSAWTVVETPNPGPTLNQLTAVADGPSGVFAVGQVADDEQVLRSWVLQRTGETWTEVPSPNERDLHNTLSGVAVTDEGNVWAVGQALDSSSGYYSHVLSGC